MKISKSKQELARIISENGGWRGAANLALFGKVSGRCYMLKTDGRPEYDITIKGFYINARDVVSDFHASPFTNWHQTILSREEYFHLYPAPDADGWVEWKGGKCPVERCTLVDVKYANGITNIGVSALTDKTHADHTSGTAGSLLATNWSSGLPIMAGIIAYRLHKTERENPEYCESVTRSIPESDERVWTNQPTIEQLAADYRNKLDYADRKQDEADKANMESDAALSELEKAIAAIGFAITPIGAVAQESELVITDWQELRVGDAIVITSVFGPNGNEGYEHLIGGEAIVVEVGDPSKQELRVKCGNKEKLIDGFTFIRRP